MNSSGTFVSLVRHELKVFKWKKDKSKRDTFVIAASVAIPVCILIAIFQEYINPMYFWYILFLFPLTVIGFGHHFIYQEWKDQTFSWWLTLPFPRFHLISSKFVACLVYVTSRLAGMFVIIALLGIYTMLWHEISWPDAVRFLGWGVMLYLFTWSTLPFVVSFALLSQTNAYSRTKFIQPYLWILFWVVVYGAVWISGIGESGQSLFTLIATIADSGEGLYFPFNCLLIGAVILSWIFSYFLNRYTAHLLEKQIDL